MPTISPPRTASETSWTAIAPASSSAVSLFSSSRASPTSPTRGGWTVNCFGADHGSRHVIGREVGDPAAAGELAAAQNGHVVGERHHLAEFVRDHQDGEVAGDDHGAQHAQHFVGLARRQHRGRLVEDQEAPLEIELLEDLAFLPLAGGDVGNPGVERHLERHPRQERLELPLLLRPVDHAQARRRAPAPDFRRPSSPAPA